MRRCRVLRQVLAYEVSLRKFDPAVASSMTDVVHAVGRPDMLSTLDDLIRLFGDRLQERDKVMILERFVAENKAAKVDPAQFYKLFTRLLQTHVTVKYGAPVVLSTQCLRAALDLRFYKYAEVLFRRLCQDLAALHGPSHTTALDVRKQLGVGNNHTDLLNDVLRHLAAGFGGPTLQRAVGLVTLACNSSIQPSHTTAFLLLAHAGKTGKVASVLEVKQQLTVQTLFSFANLLTSPEYFFAVLQALRECRDVVVLDAMLDVLAEMQDRGVAASAEHCRLVFEQAVEERRAEGVELLDRCYPADTADAADLAADRLRIHATLAADAALVERCRDDLAAQLPGGLPLAGTAEDIADASTTPTPTPAAEPTWSPTVARGVLRYYRYRIVASGLLPPDPQAGTGNAAPAAGDSVKKFPDGVLAAAREVSAAVDMALRVCGERIAPDAKDATLVALAEVLSAAGDVKRCEDLLSGVTSAHPHQPRLRALLYQSYWVARRRAELQLFPVHLQSHFATPAAPCMPVPPFLHRPRIPTTVAGALRGVYGPAVFPLHVTVTTEAPAARPAVDEPPPPLNILDPMRKHDVQKHAHSPHVAKQAPPTPRTQPKPTAAQAQAASAAPRGAAPAGMYMGAMRVRGDGSPLTRRAIPGETVAPF